MHLHMWVQQFLAVTAHKMFFGSDLQTLQSRKNCACTFCV